MRQIYKILILFVGIAILTSPVLLVYAHPGRTDSNGGHYNRSTGGYHYHHGYPEHQHINGECPYDLDDRTGQNSGSSVNSTNSDYTVSANPKPTQSISIEDNVNVNDDTTNWLGFGLGTLFGGVTTYAIAKPVVRERKRKKETYQNNYNYYFKLYAFYNPIDFVAVPKGCYVRNGLPVTSSQGAYGKYTVYVTKTGKKFHQNPHCSNTQMSKMHYMLAGTIYSPCSRCVKEEIPDLNWFREYTRIANIKINYNIP